MTTTTTPHQDRARRFRALHSGPAPLVLPNAWDAASARLVEEAGAAAVATTSAGVAWSLGAADGDRIDRDQALAAVERIVAAVGVPVSADIESGHADSAAGVAETVARVLDTGAVGVNIEDAHTGGPDVLRPVAGQCERIAAAREAADATGVGLFVNARTDVYLRAVGDPADRLAATLARAAAYLDAGADGIFVPGVTDPVAVAALAGEVGAPLNVLVGPGAPTVAEFAGLGVARISLGSSIALSAYAVAREATREVLATGGYSCLAGGLDYGEVNALLSTDPTR